MRYIAHSPGRSLKKVFHRDIFRTPVMIAQYNLAKNISFVMVYETTQLKIAEN